MANQTKVFLGHSPSCLLTSSLCMAAFLLTVQVEFSGCETDYVACKAENISYLAFTENISELLILSLVGCCGDFCVPDITVLS